MAPSLFTRPKVKKKFFLLWTFETTNPRHMALVPIVRISLDDDRYSEVLRERILQVDSQVLELISNNLEEKL